MSRIPAVDPEATTGEARALLDGVQKALGVTPNLYRVVAQSPAAIGDPVIAIGVTTAGDGLSTQYTNLLP